MGDVLYALGVLALSIAAYRIADMDISAPLLVTGVALVLRALLWAVAHA